MLFSVELKRYLWPFIGYQVVAFQAVQDARRLFFVDVSEDRDLQKRVVFRSLDRLVFGWIVGVSGFFEDVSDGGSWRMCWMDGFLRRCWMAFRRIGSRF